MKVLAAEKQAHIQIIFIIIVAALTAVLLQQYSVFHIIGIVGISVFIIYKGLKKYQHILNEF